MSKGKVEMSVGIFVLIGLACLIYLAVHLGKMEVFGKGYQVSASFDNISGLKTGAAVEVAGVDVGRVESIAVTPDNRAKLELSINPNIVLKEDAIASIRTKGIIGDKYIKLSPGYAKKTIPPGGKIQDTESAMEWEEIISQYIHGKV
ncbi:MAG: outer membrane lipid asymmetry maintenance protein MlaD [Syntrophobacterales bacterium]|jgi:phospholipid/cholesterol/gamma-HCH transport system substrate-binding protein